MSMIVHSRWEGFKIWENLVHVVVECPLKRADLNQLGHELSCFGGLMDESDIKVITKGQLISKVLFGIFNTSKNEQKQVNLRYHSTIGRIFLFISWKNSGHQQVLLKSTYLYLQ